MSSRLVYYTANGLPPNAGLPPARGYGGDVRSMSGAPWPSSLARFTEQPPTPAQEVVPAPRQASLPPPAPVQTIAWQRIPNAPQQSSSPSPVRRRSRERVVSVNHVNHFHSHHRPASRSAPAPASAPARTEDHYQSRGRPMDRYSHHSYHCRHRSRQAPMERCVHFSPASHRRRPSPELDVYRIGLARETRDSRRSHQNRQSLGSYAVHPDRTVEELFDDLEIDEY